MCDPWLCPVVRAVLARGPRGGNNPGLMSLQVRLAKLSHAQLLEFAVDACESSPEVKNKADALIAQVAPLPSWCVDIFSPVIQLAWALRARGRGRVHHLVACLQQEAAEVLLHQPNEGAAAG